MMDPPLPIGEGLTLPVGQVRGMFGEWICGHLMQMRRVSRAWGVRGRYWDGISVPKLLYSVIYMTMHLNALIARGRDHGVNHAW